MKFKGLIFVVVLLVLTAIIGIALPQVRNLFRQRAAGTASLSLPVSVSATDGQEFTVPITLATGGSAVRGVDVILNFDSSKLTVSGVVASAQSGTSFKTFVPVNASNAFDAAAVISSANSTGKVEFGAVTFDYAANQAAPTYGLTNPFNGTIVLATVKFVPKATGTTTLSFAFSSSTASTTDSNVVDDLAISSSPPYLNDILASVSPTGGSAVSIASAGDTTPPTTSVTAPAAGTLVSGTTTISANASDNVGVSKVEFYVDGALKGSDTGSPYSYGWDTTNGGTHPCNGSHTHSLMSKAYDAAGNVGTSTAVVVNMNDPAYCSSQTPTLSGVSFKMQGIAVTGISKTISLTVKGTGSNVATFSGVAVTSGTGGVFSTTSSVALSGVSAGTYDILVKDATHLRKKLGSMAIAAGVNNAPTSWGSVVVKAGDFDNNNVLNDTDVGAILQQYTALTIPVSGTNGIYDVDANAAINIYDISYTLANYTALSVPGD